MAPSSRTGRRPVAALILLVGALLLGLLQGSPVVAQTDAGQPEADQVAPPAATPEAGKTVRATFSTNGAPLQPADAEMETTQVTENGRFVVFDSEATNLVPGGPHPSAERSVYVTDRLLNTTQMVSVASNENKANGFSWEPSISDNGRFIAFYSDADNLVANDTNTAGDVFVRDIVAGTTTRVSVTSSGAQLDEYSDQPDISGDGNVIAFATMAEAVITDSNDQRDVYAHDRTAGTTGRVSLPTANVVTDGDAAYPSLDRDGSIVAFQSAATNLVPNDTNGFGDVFVRDRTAGSTERVSIADNEGQGDNGLSELADVSASGRYVVFHSAATDLVPGASASTWVVVLRDRVNGATEALSVRADGSVVLRAFNPTISANGARVAFMSRTGDLVPPAGCEPYGVIRDRPSGVTIRAFPPVSGSSCGGRDASISPDGRYLVATEFEPHLTAPDPGDVDGYDAYVRILADDTFSDVQPPHPFFEHVSWLVDTGVTNGFPDGTFKPADPVTRGGMAAFLYRYTDANTVPPITPTFSDVPITNPFYKEIEWMVDEGFTNGFPNGTFKPADPVTREAMAAFIYRLAGQPAFTPPSSPTFNDVGTNHVFRKEIEWMAATGLANGFSDGGFHPAESIARQATAAFLFRFELVMG